MWRLGSFGEAGDVFYLLRNNLNAMDVMEIATGKIRRTTNFDVVPGDCLGWWSIHPDEKRILAQPRALRLDLWMAEGFAQPANGWKSWFRHWDIP